MATSINLAPGTQYIIAARKRKQRLYALAGIVMTLIILIWVSLALYNIQLQKNHKTVEAEIALVNSEIAKLDTDAKRIVLFEQRLSQLDKLIDSHISWNPILADIERLLPTTTSLKKFNVDSTQSIITVTGNTPDVDQVALTLASLTNSPNHETIFTRGVINSINRKEEKAADGSVSSVTYEFDAALTFNGGTLFVNNVNE